MTLGSDANSTLYWMEVQMTVMSWIFNVSNIHPQYGTSYKHTTLTISDQEIKKQLESHASMQQQTGLYSPTPN